MGLVNLIDVLDRMVEVHEELLQFAELKKTTLIANNVNDLTQILNKESKLMKQVQELEEERVQQVSLFLKDKGLPANPRTSISDMVKLVANLEDKSRLLASQRRLIEVIEDLKRRNELNQQLIEQSLMYINYSYDVFLGPDEDPIYHKPAQSASSFAQRNGYFDTKA